MHELMHVLLLMSLMTPLTTTLSFHLAVEQAYVDMRVRRGHRLSLTTATSLHDWLQPPARSDTAAAAGSALPACGREAWKIQSVFNQLLQALSALHAVRYFGVVLAGNGW